MKSRRYPHSRKAIGAAILSSLFCLGLLASGQSRDTYSLTAGPPPNYDLSWHTIDGGGVMFSTGGEYELSGTIGQPDAGGSMVGPAESGYELTGGFWFAQVPGDCIFDGAVNLLDHRMFIDCSAGPSSIFTGDGCACLDLDKDRDVDLFDFGLFQLQFNGP